MDLTTQQPHPNPHPNPHHRKIELQSLQDLQYLQSNLSHAARQKLDLHFPPSASQPATFISLDGPNLSEPAQSPPNGADAPIHDPLRAHVNSLIESFLTQTWTGALQNISVNGMDATSLPHETISPYYNDNAATQEGEREGIDFAYEAYDSRLSSRVAELYAEAEALTTQVAQLRREAPGRAAREYGERLRAVVVEDEGFMQERMEEGRKGGKEEMLKLERVSEGWQEEVSEMYARGLEELRRLVGLSDGEDRGGDGRGSLTEVMGKVQRARTVTMELE